MEGRRRRLQEAIGAVDVAARRIGEGAQAGDRGKNRIVNRGGLRFLRNLIGDNGDPDELGASILRATRHPISLSNENLNRPDRAVALMKCNAALSHLARRRQVTCKENFRASENAACPRTSAPLG